MHVVLTVMENFCAPEKPEFNQYWYSPSTIKTIIDEVEALKPLRTAFLSTPSLFAEASRRALSCDLFDIDQTAFACKSSFNHFIRYDFHVPDIPREQRSMYDVVVIDPPFVTRDVLEAYGVTTKQLLHRGGRIMITTLAENAGDLIKIFDDRMLPVEFKPSIPHLVYQYNLFVNYTPTLVSGFTKVNSEVY